MDATLHQIMAELIAAHATIDALRARVAELEGQVVTVRSENLATLPPGWRLIKEP